MLERIRLIAFWVVAGLIVGPIPASLLGRDAAPAAFFAVVGLCGLLGAWIGIRRCVIVDVRRLKLARDKLQYEQDIRDLERLKKKDAAS